jgi:ATP-dependent protease ClpP protease subunit
MEAEKARGQFPRSRDLPSQSPRYWAKEKDRYLRQLLITDIEEITERRLVVCFSRLDESITETDADDLSEVLEGIKTPEVDLMLHTPGGYVDSVEKFVTVIKYLKPDYRVIIPSMAKSGGTLIALASRKILLGVNSELGPVDPQIYLPDYGTVAAEYVANDDSLPKIYSQTARAMFDRAKSLAEKYLRDGMMSGDKEPLIANALAKLSSASGYGSHGAVIDHHEAMTLGLEVEWLPPEGDLWRRIWLLHCLYDADSQRDGLGKIFEGAAFSLSRRSSS